MIHTETAAPFVWQAFQVLFEKGAFSKFASPREVSLSILRQILGPDRLLDLFLPRIVMEVSMDQLLSLI